MSGFVMVHPMGKTTNRRSAPGLPQNNSAQKRSGALYFNEKWLQSHGRSDGGVARA